MLRKFARLIVSRGGGADDKAATNRRIDADAEEHDAVLARHGPSSVAEARRRREPPKAASETETP